MIKYSFHTDDDQDSLFGSPPPSPVRGRSPLQETFIAGGSTGPIVAVPSTGARRKNVGTIALPGSHMSCAELPADLPASGLSPYRRTSSHDSPSAMPLSIAEKSVSVHTPVVASRSSTCSVSSTASFAASNAPSTSTSTRKRRMPKAKLVTPASSVPPITLPGPNDPTPPNLLRSQSSLLGLAGLVGSVKPARLYTHSLQPASVQRPCSRLPIRGSTPAHPIVLDDEQDTPHNGKHPHGQLRIPQHLDQLNPEILRSNIITSLTKEKNIFPVLESLIKLLGGEPHMPSPNPSPQLFARPYGHGTFIRQSPSSVRPLSAPGDPTIAVSPPKRRKLKHVPAGAVDWDIPFPFVAGEGPEAYRDTWARDRAKQLVTQLLELVQNATRRAAIKTAKSREKASEGRVSVQSPQVSRSVSVETQDEQARSTQVIVCESSPSTPLSPEGDMTRTPSNVTRMDTLGYFTGSLKALMTATPSSKDGTSVELEDAGGSAVPYDYPVFEEWLSQLQQFLPPETNSPTPESDWVVRSSDPSVPSSVQNITISMQSNILTAPHVIGDEAIDPALLAVSEQARSTRRSQSPTLTSTLALGAIAQVLDIPSTPPGLVHSPRTSLSSLSEPLTPLSEAFADLAPASMAAREGLYDPPTSQPAEKEHHSRPTSRGQTRALPSSLTEPPELAHVTVAQKGEERVNVSVASPAPSVSSQPSSSAISASKGTLDKQAILERARERRRQLVAEIERAKTEIWEMSVENAVLVHFMRDESLS